MALALPKGCVASARASIEVVQNCAARFDQPSHGRPNAFGAQVGWLGPTTAHLEVEVQPVLRGLALRDLEEADAGAHTVRICDGGAVLPLVVRDVVGDKPRFPAVESLGRKRIVVAECELSERGERGRCCAVNGDVPHGRHEVNIGLHADARTRFRVASLRLRRRSTTDSSKRWPSNRTMLASTAWRARVARARQARSSGRKSSMRSNIHQMYLRVPFSRSGCRWASSGSARKLSNASRSRHSTSTSACRGSLSPALRDGVRTYPGPRRGRRGVRPLLAIGANTPGSPRCRRGRTSSAHRDSPRRRLPGRSSERQPTTAPRASVPPTAAA